MRESVIAVIFFRFLERLLERVSYVLRDKRRSCELCGAAWSILW